jgi:hypothetical protein
MENKNKPSFEINNLVKETFNKIAQWHNEEATSTSLHHLSIEIVSDIIKESYRHLDLKVDFAIDMDEETRKKVDEEKAEKKRRMGVNDLDNLTDEELLREISKRKSNTPL